MSALCPASKLHKLARRLGVPKFSFRQNPFANNEKGFGGKIIFPDYTNPT